MFMHCYSTSWESMNGQYFAFVLDERIDHNWAKHGSLLDSRDSKGEYSKRSVSIMKKYAVKRE